MGGYPACFGTSGAITSYTPRNGRTERIATGLPSVINDFSVLGQHDIDASHGRTFVVFGLGEEMSTRKGLSPAARGLAQTGTIDRNGRLRPVGDLLAFEERYNPHRVDVNANAYGITRVPGGTLVAEAGGNDILWVSSDSGSVRILALMPDQVIDGSPSESVPSAIVRGPDGAFCISEYGGEPTQMGKARIWRSCPVETDRRDERVHRIIDLTFDRQGRILVLEPAEQGFDSPDRTGRLVRIEHNGKRTVLAREGLEHPGGVTVAPNDGIHPTNRTTSLGEANGQLLRLRPGRS